MNFLDYLKSNIVYLDGGMGTLLQEKGLKPGERPELWNLSNSQEIVSIHKAYYSAGSNVVCTNTFGANVLNFSENELERIIIAAVDNAKKAREETLSQKEKYIALDIGPTGKLLKPLGDLSFDEAVKTFAKTIQIGSKCGVDLIIIETMNDSYETKAALLAAKENSSLPVIVSNAYDESGKLMTGATPEAMVAMLEGLGADAIGANCSLGPKQLIGVTEKLLKVASVPIIIKPNAGLPKSINGRTLFDITANEFSDDLSELVSQGVRVVGGCCGTTPEFIYLLTEKTKQFKAKEITNKNLTVVSSYTHSVDIGDNPILIGERINPTGKKRFKTALLNNDLDYILSEGVKQEEKGVHILDVNVGLPEINEVKILSQTVCALQEVTNLPLQIDTSNVTAMEHALRLYNGKAIINSVNGKAESMHAVFPIVKKYGGVVVALTLDENGIPETAEGRCEIAKKILNTAKEYGIEKKDIVFDTLALTISADNRAANSTLKALKFISKELQCNTILGVSNVSFGLPNRDIINSIFFTLALENGLSAAIINPYSCEIMKAYYSYKALKGLDNNCSEYISVAGLFEESVDLNMQQTNDQNNQTELQYVIIKGLKDKAAATTKKLLTTSIPLDIVNNEIIPALNIVGTGYENKKVYLPQLLMSAEAAKSAFEAIKACMSIDQNVVNKGTFVIATVQGDIHDIGKNIVKLLLQNYGFDVVDLGKDVPPDIIVDTVIKLKAKIVGLSALMTTTVPAAEKTVKLLKEKAPWCKTVVGGAVLNEEYAKIIGADKYAKDAMETVRYAESICI